LEEIFTHNFLGVELDLKLLYLHIGDGGGAQAHNQLGTPGGAKSFLGGAQIFFTMSSSFKRCQTLFSRGAKNVLGQVSPPLVTGRVGPF